jgi:type IV pilus assembly protein PilB
LIEAGFTESRIPDLGEFFRPSGCQSCSNTGYRGRIGLYEVMPMTEEIERLTVERASAETVKHVAVEQGMYTLRDDGLHKASEGLTSIEEIARVVK